ncbi:MAG TPA: hypothetical protein VGS18_01705, partial [Thermoplasmata archaeon]|nr:hypothetical protein [Thermoplasmata archaeon]
MYGPAGLTEYLPAAGDPSAVSVVAGPVLVSLQYQTYYYVSITTSTGGTVSPASGWVPSGSSFTRGAVPIGTNTVTHWVGTGSGSFSGKTTVGTVHVNGPITEVAEFSPAVPPAIQVTSIWTSPALLGGLAAAGLVAGLGIGLLVARSGRRSASGGEGSA